MKAFLPLLALAAAAPILARAAQEPRDLATLRKEGEALIEKGLFERARAVYADAAQLELDPEDARWVRFRLADTRWRAAAATENPDTTELDRARAELEELARVPERVEERDRVFAEASESLGDFHWDRRNSGNWGGAGPAYTAALEFWAGSSDLDLARRRYLDVVFKVAQPSWYDARWGYAGYANSLGEGILKNAAEIAREPADRARAHWLYGMQLYQQGGNVRAVERAEEEFRAVLDVGRDAEWYDDALYQLGLLFEERGRPVAGENGGWTFEPDYDAAVEVYRRLTTELDRGETRYWSQAEERIERILGPEVALGVDRFFLPESEIVYRLRWRNVERVELALYPIDLTRDVRRHDDDDFDDWLDHVRVEGTRPVRSWVHETGDDGKHRWGQAEPELEEKLPFGAYVFEARGKTARSRALVLVSDVALTIKGSGREVLVWATDVRTGEPQRKAELSYLFDYYDGRETRRADGRVETGEDGTFLIPVPEVATGIEMFVAVKVGERQAYAVHESHHGRASRDETWRIYAYTDRPVYRPHDVVHWKAVARTHDGETYSTPVGRELAWEIFGPTGEKVAKGKTELGAFGATWDELQATEAMTLGEYTIRFDSQGRHVASTRLFRLEEYKAPEFEVGVRFPEEPDGSGEPRPKLFRAGDRVEFDVEASYYFGGPVAAANVEVFVWQKPFFHAFPKQREFPWLFGDVGQTYYWGQGQQVLHEVLTTDAEGRARVAFDTQLEAVQDFEYTVEARVVDASRREVIGGGSVRVARTSYFADVDVRHAIHTPSAPLEVEIRTEDANGRAVSARGTLVATRERWVEIWLDAAGREVQGQALSSARASVEFPPPGWRPKYRGVQSEEVARTELSTDAEGAGSWSFVPGQDGVYRVTWTGPDEGGDVTASAQAFVADEETRELGWLPAGVEIVVDKESFRVGENAAVMLMTPSSGRWVLFTVEAETLQHYEVVHLSGSVRLLHLSIDASHVPNVYLGAVTVFGGEAYSDLEEIVVPPDSKFLDVSIEADREEYEPGTAGTLTLTVRDRDGRPVVGDLGVSVYDDSLSYVQDDLAGDPRRFFYGERRGDRVILRGTFQHGSFARFVRDEAGELRERRLDGAWDDRADTKEERRGGRFRGPGDTVYYDGDEFAGAVRDSSSLGEAAQSEERLGLRQMAKSVAAPGVSGPAPAAGGGPEPRVRSDFRDTALWIASVTTDADGRARVEVPFPDSTTRWKAVVRAADEGARVGMGTSTTRTRQPLIARLQAPRFFQVGDRLTVSGLIDNQTSSATTVRVSLEAAGLALLGAQVDGELVADLAPVTIAANGQARVDWRVEVREPGEAVLMLKAIGEEHADAVQRRLPVHEHGIEVLEARSGKFDGAELAFSIDLPAARGPGSTTLAVQVTPSMAVTMLDALPYLVDYPYGCTEQTLSRFVPSAIVARTLREQGLSAEEAMRRVFGGVEGEYAAKTHPKGKQPLDELDEMIRRGLERLYDYQHADGGFGWWKGDESDEYMSAYVLWGLALARQAGVDVRPGVLENVGRFLVLRLVEQEGQPDLQAWMLHALATWGGSTGEAKERQFEEAALANLMRDDGKRLNAYSRALACLAAHALGRADDARLLAEQLRNGAIVDATPDTSIVMVGAQTSRPFVQPTAHWGEDRIWRRWSEGGVEATAFALRALLAVDPASDLVAPVTNWLVKNRRGAQWSNTRDTAIVVLALDEYLRASGELAAGVGYEVVVNGTVVERRELAQDELLDAPGRVEVDPELLRDGANEIRIRRTSGEAPLYFAAYAEFFSQEEPIRSRGNELFARREYFKLVGRPTLLRGYVYDRVPLEDGGVVQSGERVEVVVTLEAKNDLEYVMLEDLKPAGLEATQVQSGERMIARELKRSESERRFGGDPVEGGTRGAHLGEAAVPGYTGRSRSAHQELRDRKVALFLDRIPQGTWELRYDLRAEVPGSFHALPLLGHAMYVPEIRCNGEELRLDVLEDLASGG